MKTIFLRACIYSNGSSFQESEATTKIYIVRNLPTVLLLKQTLHQLHSFLQTVRMLLANR
jgi:hypothetical protein